MKISEIPRYAGSLRKFSTKHFLGIFIVVLTIFRGVIGESCVRRLARKLLGKFPKKHSCKKLPRLT